MQRRYLAPLGALAVVLALISLIAISVAGQAPAAAGQAPSVTTSRPALPKPGPAPRTAWGDPDLQGTWFVMESVPFERSQANAGKAMLTDAEVAALDTVESRIVRQLEDRAVLVKALIRPEKAPVGECAVAPDVGPAEEEEMRNRRGVRAGLGDRGSEPQTTQGRSKKCGAPDHDATHDGVPKAPLRQLIRPGATYGKEKVVRKSTQVCKNRMGDAASPRYSSGPARKRRTRPGQT